MELRSQAKLLEAQRLEARTKYDIEMLQEVGYCSGIENYSRHLAGLPAGGKTIYADRLFPEGFPVIYRRVARYDSAIARDVGGRQEQEGRTG